MRDSLTDLRARITEPVRVGVQNNLDKALEKAAQGELCFTMFVQVTTRLQGKHDNTIFL